MATNTFPLVKRGSLFLQPLNLGWPGDLLWLMGSKQTRC